MSKVKNEPQEDPPGTVLPHAIPQGGSPASHNEPPGSDVLALRFIVDSIEPTEAEVGSEDVMLVVRGSGFDQGAQIVFNGGAEPTAFVSAGELTTTVKPSTASAAATVPVSVAQSGFIFDPPQTFTFTEPVEGRRHKRRRED